MDELLAKAGSQAVTFAIRSGISLATGYALKSLGQFLDTIPDSEKKALEHSKSRLETKIRVITPAIDLMELISARGNTSLDSTLQLTNQLKTDIKEFQERIIHLNNDLTEITNSQNTSGRAWRVGDLSAKQRHAALKEVQTYINDLLTRIEEAIPLISLALTTSGANLSSRMPDSVSPGRFLQAGKYLSEADQKFESIFKGFEYQQLDAETRSKTEICVQVGPTFTVIVYTIFYSGNNHISWKEEYRKCNMKLWRVNSFGAKSLNRASGGSPDKQGKINSNETDSEDTEDDELEYRYVLTLEENFQDGRYHDKDESPKYKAIDVSTVTRLFFSASGRLLEIDESTSPVLVLKLNKVFDPLSLSTDKRNKRDEEDDDSDFFESDPEDQSYLYEQNHEYLAHDPTNVEWLAFEQYVSDSLNFKDDSESETESETGSEDDDYDDKEVEVGNNNNKDDVIQRTEDSNSSILLTTKMDGLTIADTSTPKSEGKKEFFTKPNDDRKQKQPKPLIISNQFELGNGHGRSIASLSLLEYLLRLTALQSNDQESIYNTVDERIALYLSDENATASHKRRQYAGNDNGIRDDSDEEYYRPYYDTSGYKIPKSGDSKRYYENSFTSGNRMQSRSSKGKTKTGGGGVSSEFFTSPLDGKTRRQDGGNNRSISGNNSSSSSSSNSKNTSNNNNNNNKNNTTNKSEYQTPIKPSAPSSSVPTPQEGLTPWEKDRLYIRRQLLLQKNKDQQSSKSNNRSKEEEERRKDKARIFDTPSKKM